MIIGLGNCCVQWFCPGTDTAVAADAATKGATDAAATAGAADAGVAAGVGDAALAGGAADVAGGAALGAGADAALGAGAAGAGLGTAGALDTAGAGLGAAGTSAEGATLLSTAAPVAAGGGAGSLLPAAAGAAGLAASSGGDSGPTAQPQDLSASPADASPSMLTATSPSDIQGISPDTASMLGIDSGGGGVGTIPAGGGDAGTVFDPSITGEDPSMMEALTTSPSGDATLAPDNAQAFADWFKNPKNLATAGLLGISGFNALSRPKLPGAAQTALGAAGPAVQQATTTIQTGGTGSPLWAGQKAAIDTSINQQIQQQTEALMQAAANSGQQGPGPPTGVVAQQIAAMTSNLNVQRQQLYEQALNQIVNQAVSELTGGNQTLMAVANEQLALEQQARQSAAATAQLALELQQLSF